MDGLEPERDEILIITLALKRAKPRAGGFESLASAQRVWRTVIKEFARLLAHKYPDFQIADFERRCGDPKVTFTEIRTTRCRASADGDCDWRDCPQTRDGEPEGTDRDCPLLDVPSDVVIEMVPR